MYFWWLARFALLVNIRATFHGCARIAVSQSSTQAYTISLDARLRMEDFPALNVWECSLTSSRLLTRSATLVKFILILSDLVRAVWHYLGSSGLELRE